MLSEAEAGFFVYYSFFFSAFGYVVLLWNQRRPWWWYQKLRQQAPSSFVGRRTAIGLLFLDGSVAGGNNSSHSRQTISAMPATQLIFNSNRSVAVLSCPYLPLLDKATMVAHKRAASYAFIQRNHHSATAAAQRRSQTLLCFIYRHPPTMS